MEGSLEFIGMRRGYLELKKAFEARKSVVPRGWITRRKDLQGSGFPDELSACGDIRQISRGDHLRDQVSAGCGLDGAGMDRSPAGCGDGLSKKFIFYSTAPHMDTVQGLSGNFPELVKANAVLKSHALSNKP